MASLFYMIDLRQLRIGLKARLLRRILPDKSKKQELLLGYW